MAGKGIVAVEWHLCNRRLRRKYGRIQCRQINRCQADIDPESALQEREVFRFDRVMFGSDWPVCLLGIEYGEWVVWGEKAISGATEVLRRSLFYETAARFYRL